MVSQSGSTVVKEGQVTSGSRGSSVLCSKPKCSAKPESGVWDLLGGGRMERVPLLSTISLAVSFLPTNGTEARRRPGSGVSTCSMVLLASFEADLTLTHFPSPWPRPCEKAASCIWRLAWSLLNLGSFVPMFKDLEGCFNYVQLRVLRAIVKF